MPELAFAQDDTAFPRRRTASLDTDYSPLQQNSLDRPRAAPARELPIVNLTDPRTQILGISVEDLAPKRK